MARPYMRFPLTPELKDDPEALEKALDEYADACEEADEVWRDLHDND